MNYYQEVTNQAEMDSLLHDMGRFHDSLTKEIHIINQSAVLDNHRMLGNYQFDAQLLIQSQLKPYAIELLFIDVTKFELGHSGEHLGASGSVERKSIPSESVKIQMKFDGGLEVSAKRLFYRVRSDWLGKQSRLNSELPSPDAIPAKSLEGVEGHWRQCSSCSEAWEEAIDRVYSICPGCLALTELQP